MSRVIVSILSAASKEMWNFMELTARNRQEYAMKHQYQLFLRRYIDIFHFPEERITNMIDALKQTDYLLSMGVDTLFTNFNIRIDSLIIQNPTADIILSNDVNGLNNDIMILRNSRVTNLFLRSIVGTLDEYDQDQEAMATLIPMMPGLKVAEIPQKQMNAMPYWLYHYKNDNGGTWQKGDFIFHAPGISFENRMKVMKDVLKQVVKGVPNKLIEKDTTRVDKPYKEDIAMVTIKDEGGQISVEPVKKEGK